jgi:uncharacterized membrane protein YfhO
LDIDNAFMAIGKLQYACQEVGKLDNRAVTLVQKQTNYTRGRGDVWSTLHNFKTFSTDPVLSFVVSKQIRGHVRMNDKTCYLTNDHIVGSGYIKLNFEQMPEKENSPKTNVEIRVAKKDKIEAHETHKKYIERTYSKIFKRVGMQADQVYSFKKNEGKILKSYPNKGNCFVAIAYEKAVPVPKKKKKKN